DKPSRSDATNSREVRVETSKTTNMDVTDTGEYVADHSPVHITDQYHANQTSALVESSSNSEGDSDANDEWFNSKNENSELPSSSTTEAIETLCTDNIGGNHMMTKQKKNNMPKNHTSLIVAKGTIEIEPRIVDQALKTPHWYATMKEEIDALLEKKT
ncbi:hypothetical protein HAX54_010430, partial [Datura stramonium]|nr:hypothetical protein [Datura stramonium]